MDNRTEDNNEVIMVNNRIRTISKPLTSSKQISGTNVAIDTLVAEGGSSFYNYVDWIGLAKDPDLIVLSAVHHYYFDDEDMKIINTVINIKQLNLIKDIDFFFRSIYKIIPNKTNFIGCFLDNKTQEKYVNDNILSQYLVKHNVDPFENGITSRIPFLNTVYNLMDSKTDRFLTRRNVSLLLKKRGFKVLDMTELNGLTYFHAQKPRDFMAA